MRTRLLFICAFGLFGSACKVKTGEDASLSETRVGNGVESHISPEAANFRDKFVSMKSARDVDSLLNEMKENYPKYKHTDMKLIAAQLIPLAQLRGILYRLRPVIEGRSKAFHSIIVSSFMQIATGSRIFANANNNGGHLAWKAVNQYFNRPYQGMFAEKKAMGLGVVKKIVGGAGKSATEGFQQISEFQNFLVSEIIPELNTAIGRVAGLKISDSEPVVWDNRIIFGTAAFNFGAANNFQAADEEDRFITITEAERHAILAALHATKHNILVFSAYNMDLLPELTAKLGFLVGVDTVGGWNVNGMSAADRKQTMCGTMSGTTCNGQFQTMFTLRTNANGPAMMKEAYAELVNGTKALRSGWDILKGQGNSKFANMRLVNPGLLPMRNLTEKTVRNIESIVAGKPVRNAVTGRVLTVNTPALYNAAPADMKQFIPSNFTGGKRYHENIEGFSNVRNYEFGQSAQWNASVYGKYFSDVKSGTEVPEIVRDLSQTWGGFVANAPVVGMSMVF